MILTLEEIELLIITKKSKIEASLTTICSSEYKEDYDTQKRIMLCWFETINRLEELIEYKKKIERERKECEENGRN